MTSVNTERISKAKAAEVSPSDIFIFHSYASAGPLINKDALDEQIKELPRVYRDLIGVNSLPSNLRPVVDQAINGTLPEQAIASEIISDAYEMVRGIAVNLIPRSPR